MSNGVDRGIGDSSIDHFFEGQHQEDLLKAWRRGYLRRRRASVPQVVWESIPLQRNFTLCDELDSTYAFPLEVRFAP